jgi:hypothetical protein
MSKEFNFDEKNKIDVLDGFGKLKTEIDVTDKDNKLLSTVQTTLSLLREHAHASYQTYLKMVSKY